MAKRDLLEYNCKLSLISRDIENDILQDEHGQSMIHFAAVRSYSKDGLYHLLLETQVNVGFRDELYRTARDVAEQANIRDNVDEIDRFVIYLAARGKGSSRRITLVKIKRTNAQFRNLTRRRDREARRAFVGGLRSYSGRRGRRSEYHRHRRGKRTRCHRAVFTVDSQLCGKLLA